MELLEEENVEFLDVTPVYVLESSIPDVLALNELNKKIEAKEAEKNEKEKEVADVEKQRNDLNEKIGEINNGQHINEVALNLKKLKLLDESLFNKRGELEDIFADLRKMQEDGEALDTTTRKMVEKMTEEYNSLVEQYIKAVDRYRTFANFNDYKESEDLVDELGKYKKFENYEAILAGKELVEEETKEEVKAEVTPIVEEQAVEEKQEAELSEVKVDALPEAEVQEEVKAEVTPIAEEAKEETKEEENKIEMPSFEELMAKAKEAEEAKEEESKTEETAPVEEQPVAEVTPLTNEVKEESAPVVDTPVVDTPVVDAPTVEAPVVENTEAKPTEDLKIALLTSLHDRIAETDGAKIEGIKKEFAKSNSSAQILTLTNKAA